MSDNIKVRIKSSDGVTVQVQETGLVSATTNSFNIPNIPSLGDILDVDTSAVTNGSVLVYKTAQNKWTATTTLDLQNMEGGEY